MCPFIFVSTLEVYSHPSTFSFFAALVLCSAYDPCARNDGAAPLMAFPAPFRAPSSTAVPASLLHFAIPSFMRPMARHPRARTHSECRLGTHLTLPLRAQHPVSQRLRAPLVRRQATPLGVSHSFSPSLTRPLPLAVHRSIRVIAAIHPTPARAQDPEFPRPSAASHSL
ncbi:hypothetical protein DFH09DRAFT_1339537 [Mycena vulgaris]|nr:hypothetical protein DFH09DRAFT_1339537 [Mycena vulgaris]